MTFQDEEEIQIIQIRENAQRIVAMQIAIDAFSNHHSTNPKNIITSFQLNPILPQFTKSFDSLWQMLWTFNLFLRNRSNSQEVCLALLEYIIPEIQKYQITPTQLLLIFCNSAFTNYSAIDLLFHKGIIQINDILTHSKTNKYFYSHYKSDLESYYNRSLKTSSTDHKYLEEYEKLTSIYKMFNPVEDNATNRQLLDLIKNDKIHEFQTFISRNNISLISKFQFHESNKNDITNEITMIEYAAYAGAIQIFKFLWNNLEIRFNQMNENDKCEINLPLYSIYGANYEIIHLVEKYFNYDVECLILSIELHHYSITDYLEDTIGLSFNFKLDYASTYRYLFRMIYSYNMKYILSHLDDVEYVINIKDYDTGLTPIQTAAILGFTDMVKVFSTIDGIDLHQTSRSGETLLYMACVKGFVDIVDFLVNCEYYDINVKNDNGTNALFAVVLRENPKYLIMLELLLSKGIDVNAVNHISKQNNLYEKYTSALGCT